MSYTVEILPEVHCNDVKLKIIELWKNEGYEQPEKRYKWLYEADYARKNLHTHLILHDQVIIGLGSVLIKGYNSKRVAISSNFLIEKMHRTLGPALKLQKEIYLHMRKALKYDCYYGYANANSAPVLSRIGYAPGQYSVRYVYLINPGEYIFNSKILNVISGKLFQNAIFIWNSLKVIFLLPNERLKIRDFCVYNEDKSLQLSDYERWRYGLESLKDYKFFVHKSDLTTSVKIIFYIENNVAYIENIINVDRKHLSVIIRIFNIHILRRYDVRSISLTAVIDESVVFTLKKAGLMKRKDDENRRIFRDKKDDCKNIFLNSIQLIADGELDL